MVLAAIVMVVVPLMRQGDASPIAAGAIVSLLPLGVALLYFTFSNWQWDTPTAANPTQQANDEQTASLADMATRLEQKLSANPEDVEGWLMLGRTYVVLSRYPDAVEAYGTARELTDDQDVNALTGYAESLAMLHGGVMDDEAAGIFEQALVLSPDDRKALWYGGLAAFERGRAALARDRWQRILALDPPEQMAVMLREQIAAANAALGIASSGPVQSVPDATESSGDGLTLTVSLAPGFSGRAHPDTPVFILARQSGAAGPPLAVVRRTVADLPLEIVLTDADSMMPGRILSAFDVVEVVARVSLGGTPTAQTGDLSGSRTVASNGKAVIVIDSIVGK